MKQVMVRAWEIAKEGQRNFGGKVSEYFAIALKMAWTEFKEGKKNTMYEIAEMLQEKLGNSAKVNVWERYGKRRIYINKGFKQKVAVLEFDGNDNLISELKLDGMTLFGARQNGVENELLIVDEVVKGMAA